MATKQSTSTARLIFAKQLRRRRLALNLSQEDLAEKSGLHRTYIGSVERGERNISIDNMDCLALVLACPIIDLLVDDADESS